MKPELHLLRRILANDLRLYCRSGRGLFGRVGGLALQVPLVAFLHLPAFFAMQAVGQAGGGSGGGFAVLLVLLLLLAAAFQRSLETLYNRGDLPLLLASPVPLRVVVASRLVDIALTTLAGSALFIIPLLDCAVLLHGRTWLWGWPTWLAAVALAVPCALAATLALVRRLGARRTRVLVQLFSLAIGMSAFAGLQASNWLARPGQTGANHPAAAWLRWFDRAPLAQLAAAAQGNLLWLASLGLAGALALWWALRHLSRVFGHGVLAAGADTGETPARRRGALAAWQGRFERPRWQVIILKELRLVFRDPLLLARASTQIVTIVPGLAGAFLYRASVGLAGVALVGPAMAAALLAALMTTNDEAPECAATSPTSPRRTIVARAGAAATLPTLLGWSISLVVLALGHPFVALVCFVGATLNSASIAWLTACTVRPHSAEERSRQKQPMIIGQSLYGMFVGGLGAGSIALGTAGQSIVANAMLGAAVLAAACGFLFRPRRHWRTA